MAPKQKKTRLDENDILYAKCDKALMALLTDWVIISYYGKMGSELNPISMELNN